MAGPQIRSDIIDVYVFRRGPSAHREPIAQFLQLQRARDPMAQTWQPVMGHAEEGETATDAALRELKEETGYAPHHGLTALWQLDFVHTYFLAKLDCIVLGPCFAAEVAADQEPVIDDAHHAHRWIDRDCTDNAFLWPGQRTAIEHITRDILCASDAEKHLRLR